MVEPRLVITKPAIVGDLEIGEFWRERECDGCGQKRVSLDIRLFDEDDYDNGLFTISLCAQCLRNLANSLDKFETEEYE